MKKTSLMVILLILISSTVFSEDDQQIIKQKELLIIDKGTILYESETDNSKKIRGLDFLEKVYLIKEGSKKKIFVLTEKNEKGWVVSGMTSITPSGWKKINNFDDVSLFIPNNNKFSIKKGKWGKHRIIDKIIESKEDKIFSDDFFVLIYTSGETIEERIEKNKESDADFNKKSNYIEKFFKDKKLIIKTSIGIDFTKEFLVILPYKENRSSSIFVTLDSPDPTPEEIRTALKILFSFEIK